METRNSNSSKKLIQAQHEEGVKKEHFPKSPNQTWRDFKPARYFVEQAFYQGCSVEEFIEIFYS